MPASITHASTEPEPIMRVARDVHSSVTAHASAAPSPPRIAIPQLYRRCARHVRQPTAAATSSAHGSLHQRAADRAFEVAGAAPIPAVRMAAIDIMVFAGVELDDAVEAVRAGILEQEVRRPPAPAPPGPLDRLRAQRRR